MPKEGSLRNKEVRTRPSQLHLFFQLARLVASIALLLTTAVYAEAADDNEPASAGKAADDGQRANNGLWSRASNAWQNIQAELGKRGITLSFNYTGEVFYSFRLEPDKVTRYRDETNLRLTLDTEKLGLWKGGEFFINAQGGYGRGINVNADGVTLPISNIDARNFAQISEYGLKQRLWAGAVQFIVGKQDVNAIFCVNTNGSYLVNPTFALIPTVPMPTFPAPALGATVIAVPWKQLSFGLGFYEGTPRIGGSGFDTFFDGTRGYFSVLETAWKPSLGEDHRLPGDYRAGFWYHSGSFTHTRIGGGNPETLHNDYGFYLLMNQTIYKKKGVAEPDTGLGVFLQIGWAPSDRNPVTGYVGTGLQYQGVLPGRTHDTLGLGVSNTWLADANGDTQLTSVELFYCVQIFSWLGVQPDIQYFYNTGDHSRNGLAAGCRWLVRF
jgi:porin